MCLFTKDLEPLISTYDITCYKILEVKDDKFLSPYQKYPFEIGKEVTDKVSPDPQDVFDYQMIEEGYFHSFTRPSYAEEILPVLRRRNKKANYKIFEAVIPAGTQYLMGQQDVDICSKTLKIIKEYERTN